MATTKTSPHKGDKFNLTAVEGHGIGIGAVSTGTKVTVDLVHSKPVAGVGGTEGVLFSWVPEDEHDLRSAHLPTEDFLRLFEKAGK